MNRDKLREIDELHDALTQYEIDREHDSDDSDSGSNADADASADADVRAPRIVFDDAADDDPEAQQAVLRTAGWTLIVAVLPVSAYFVAGVSAFPEWPPVLLVVPIVLLGIGYTVLAVGRREAVDQDSESESPPDDGERSDDGSEDPTDD